eukprot:CAMPEP_0182464486 /NCGR_PEP_ID=MMETSP1319-20130603/8673_1 /TAXON_ID=172717 /ORGANISM="Bolidomonas pacifica, Strain RCC208" /LENGTH=114 /DNA_ID=CAMNT_0024664131 /DNA_START=9 /DNA_END=350 /DNA_ORIENTATION=-
MSAEEIAQAFVQHYYTTFDSEERPSLASLYTESSVMTFEGQQFQGATNILGKITSFGQIAHNITTVDVQPSVTESAMLVYVGGHVSIDGDSPIQFSQVFQLVATGPGEFVLNND